MADPVVGAFPREVVEWYIEWNPIFATHVGIHDKIGAPARRGKSNPIS